MTTELPLLTDLDAQQAFAVAANTLNNLVREGWTPNSAKKFVETGNISVLRHTGKVSVQLHDPKA
jgi:hypothetical protein